MAYQRLDGIYWVFNFGEEDCPATMEIPVNSVLGDTEGHDKLTARITNRQGTGNRGLCWYCDCPFQLLGDPFEGLRTNLTLCGPIRTLRNQGDAEAVAQLNSMDYKKMHDGMVDVHFSDPERGLHGCCPAEVLHCFHMGLAERSITSAFDIRRLRKGRKPNGQGKKPAK